MAQIFGWFLEGHPLLINRSMWRNFPMIRSRRWVKDNMVLLGDAKATAHFSIGSGTKLGFMPFPGWRPEARPAARSHVSALMAGIMIRTGIYGVLRLLGFLGAPAPWWACRSSPLPSS